MNFRTLLGASASAFALVSAAAAQACPSCTPGNVPEVGKTATPGIVVPAGSTCAWLRDGTPIPGATSCARYTYQAADIGHRVGPQITPPGRLIYAALSISNPPPAAGTVGAPYSYSGPTVSGGSGSVLFRFSGWYPPGLTPNKSTGGLTGMPTTAATYIGLSETVTDSVGGSATLAPFAITIASAPPAAQLAISGTAPSTATVGTPYSFGPIISGGSGGNGCVLTGGAVPGLGVTSCALAGMPTTVGVWAGLGMTVTDSKGDSASLAPFTLTVAASSGGGGTSTTVTNTAQLTSALAAAHGGDTILLAAGTYSGLGTLTGLNYSSAVTITSADPSNEAVLGLFTLQNSSNITFSRLQFSAAGITDYTSWQVTNTTNVSFDHDAFSGNVGAQFHGVQTSGAELGLSGDTNISVTNSDFGWATFGITATLMNGLTIRNNSFHDMDDDGMDVTNTVHAQIQDNVFVDMFHGLGNHPDGIQMWGSGTSDVAITGNLMLKGLGDPYQGIFLRDTTPGWAQNVTISNNYMAGVGYNSIYLENVSVSTVSSNTVEAFVDPANSRIMVTTTNGVTMTNNSSSSYITVNQNNTNFTETGDVTTNTFVTDNGAALAKAWAAAHPGWTGTLPATIAALLSP